MKMSAFPLSLMFVSIIAISNANDLLLQCRDEDNQPVDWFVAYKLPRIQKSTNKNVAKGIGYVYITSSTLLDGWKMSDHSTNDSNSIMGNTLAALYGDQVDSLAYILYNDEPPHGKTTFSLGHTKGVTIGSNTGGLWLVHSVPHYPPEPRSFNYSYPPTGVRYGQSFICISLHSTELDKIGGQLFYNEPNIYSSAFPETLKTLLPNLASAAQGQHVSSAPWFRSESFTSVGGHLFTSYAKSMNFGKELYADWVASDLETDLATQTWLNGPGKMDSECNKPFKVENIESISLSTAGKFTTHQDHSKWAVSLSNSKPFICVGDINRMLHQEQRGGGTVCLKNVHLWSVYRQSIVSLDTCPRLVI